MTGITKPKQSLVGIELVRVLAYEGYRIFTTAQAKELSPRVGLKDAYVAESLHHLRRNGWIVSLRRGLHALSSTVPGVTAVHEFEIGTALVEPSAISHWSALHQHGLTEQVPRVVFVLTTAGATVPRTRAEGSKGAANGFVIGGTTYRFTQVRPKRFFGTERIWVGDARVVITDLERTLLDGLSMPEYYGDFSEVLHAFQVAVPRLNMERITRYALRLGTATAKRLGWVLEAHGVNSFHVEQLASLPVNGYRQLDPSGLRRGPSNSRWMVQENLPGSIKA